jgi:uncharacterized protein (DUF488 family)
MEVYTIGFTQTSAREFFGRLKRAGVRRLVDVRLNNSSQLAGFAKRDDLAYFLEALCGADYRHEPRLAPSEELLKAYQKKELPWEQYAQRYLALLAERRVAEVLDRALFDVPAALLCSEPAPDCCHRRLAAEYLAAQWGGLQVLHL